MNCSDGACSGPDDGERRASTAAPAPSALAVPSGRLPCPPESPSAALRGARALLGIALPLVGVGLGAAAASAAPAPAPATELAVLAEIAGASALQILALTLVAVALAYPLARAAPAPWLLACVLIAPLARSIGALHLGLPPGTGAFAWARLAGDLPLAALLVQLRLRSRPPGLLDAAADLGAGPLRRFWAVEWPHLRPALALAAVLVLLLGLGDATTAAIAGGGKRYTLALALREALLVDGQPRRAAILAAIFVAIAIPCAVGLARGLRAAARGRAGGAQRPALGGLALLLVCGAPAAALLAPALAEPLGPGDALLLAQVPATLASAGIAAVIAAAIGGAAGLGLRARWGPAFVLPLALPPAVHGAAWLALGPRLGLGPGAALTVLALLPGQIAIAYAGAVLASAGAERLADGARDLGADLWARVRWLWWPRFAPTLAALALVAFAYAVGDAGASAFTSGPGGSTLAVGLEIVHRGPEVGVVPRWSLGLAVLPVALCGLALRLRRR